MCHREVICQHRHYTRLEFELSVLGFCSEIVIRSEGRNTRLGVTISSPGMDQFCFLKIVIQKN